MNSDLYVDALSAPLPEDIARRREAGDLQGALRAIMRRAERPFPPRRRVGSPLPFFCKGRGKRASCDADNR